MIVDQNKENYDMAKRIAQFEKVSFVQFKEGYKDAFGDVSDEEIREIYEKIKLPRRATAGSAGATARRLSLGCPPAARPFRPDGTP